jgi:hypothetical protein
MNMELRHKSIPLPERGKYYRGLLILIRKDQTIDSHEREMMMQLGQALDFDRRFCENAVDDLLKNPNIKSEPVKFSDKEIAKAFMQDAVALALADGRIHPKELSWLKKVAYANGLDVKRFL